MHSDRKYVPYLLVAPAILILLTFSYAPLPFGFWLSVHKMLPTTGEQIYVGLENFRTLLTNKNFWQSFNSTWQYVLVCTFVMLVVGTMVALALNTRIRGVSAYLTILFIPWVISEIVVSTTWRFMLHPDFGLLNYIFSPLGVKPSDMLVKPNLVMWGVAIVTLWKTLAYSTLLLLAGLQNISSEYTEASRIDGCNALTTFWHIILPLFRPTLMIVALLYIISCINQSGLLLILTNGGPVRTTETLALYLYKQAFMNYQLTKTASMSVILAAINSVVVIIYFILNRTVAKAGDLT